MTKKQKLLSAAALAAQTAVPDNSGTATPAGSNGPAGADTETGGAAVKASETCPFGSDDEELEFELASPARIRGARRSVGEIVTINRAEWRDLVAVGALTEEA